MKILVAIPTYDGKLHVEIVKALLDEQVIAMSFGDELLFQFLPGCSHPAMGRNQLAQQFMDSEAERLIFLDSDVTFDPGSIVKIAQYPVDFVGGAYRFKMKDENYPVGWISPDVQPFLQANEYNLLEVSTLPGGFLSLSKKVFETLKAKHPDREYEHFGKKAHCYFQMPFEGQLYGEDSFFCKEWRECGGKVFLDPEISFTHWDFSPVPYKGHIGNWLKSRV